MTTETPHSRTPDHGETVRDRYDAMDRPALKAEIERRGPACGSLHAWMRTSSLSDTDMRRGLRQDDEDRPRKMAPTNAAISHRILSLVARGVPLPEAIDAVLGAGAHAEIAGDVYDTLRKVTDRGQ